MLYDRARPDGPLRSFAVIAVFVSLITLAGCDATRPFGDTILDGLGTAGKATVGGLTTAGRATVGGLQWVVDAGETGIVGRTAGTTEKPLLLVTGRRFPGIKMEEISVLSMTVVDGKGAQLAWKQGAIEKTSNGPALTISVEPGAETQIVDVTGVLIYRNARWTLSARCSLTPGRLWTTELITATRQ